MFLKFRYRLGYESLCAQVADSISWHRFCRIEPGQKVPHPSTLMKITTRCGNRRSSNSTRKLLTKASEDKLLRLGKVRADTTVVEADVAYPTDVELLAHPISKTARLVSRVKAAGGATRTGYRDRSRAARRRLRAITYQLRHYRLRRRGEQATEQAHAALTRTTAQLAGLAEAGTAEAIAVLRNARRTCRRATARRRGRPRRATSELATTIEITTRVVTQARIRVAGDTPAAASRIVSLHDPDARPIVKGRLDKPVEFGYKAQILDNADGVIVDHTVEAGNPPDAPGLAPAIARVAARCGRLPRAVTADTNYGEQAVVDDLHTLGVSTVAIPRKGRPDTTGHAHPGSAG